MTIEFDPCTAPPGGWGSVRSLAARGAREGNVAAYYPECNPLLPLWHYAEGGYTPAAKSIPVRVQRRMNGGAHGV